MRFVVRFVITLMVCVIPEVGLTQVFRHFSDREGAPVTSIMSIAQDNAGFMWFGTSRGLYRYDSKVFKRYAHDGKDARSVASDYTHSIFSDSKGRLWMGTWGGLSLYNREDDSFITARHDPADPASLPDNRMNCFAEDREHNVWVATSKGLNKILYEKGKIKVVRYLPDFPQIILCMAADPAGGLWLGTMKGLFRFKDGKAEFIGLKNTSNPEDPYFIRSAHFRGKDQLWLGTTRGLVKLDTKTREFRHIESWRLNGTQPTIYGIAEDHNRKLWLAGESGLAMLDPETYQIKWHLRDKANVNALVDNEHLTVYMDPRRGLWIGSYNQGISYLNTNLPDFSHWPSPSENHLPEFYLTGKVGKTPSGKIWAIAANNGQIRITDDRTNEVFTARLNFPTDGKYESFFVDDSYTLWCGGDDFSLTRYNLRTGKSTKEFLKETLKVPMHGNGSITMISEDKQGRVWISGGVGLIYFDRREGQFEQAACSDIILSVTEDSGGNIWFGGVRSIHVMNSGSSKISKIEVDRPAETENQLYATRIAEDPSGKIWIASQDGLLGFNSKTKRFSPHISDAPELLNYTLDIQADREGYLWLNAEHKLICYHPGNKIVKVYDYRDGLPKGGLLLLSGSVQDNNGNLYFPTSEGTFKFNPADIKSTSATAPIVFTSLKLFNNPVSAGDHTAILTNSIETTRELTFRHDQNIFTLDFALLSYGRSEMNRYAYILENFEKNWNYVQSASATYTNLAPGSYTLIAKAANGDGYWTKAIHLKITVLPPWWQTWWAYLVYLLLTASAVYTVTRFLWIRSSFRRETAMNQMKLDFFTNISHEIRTHLSLISGPLEKAYEQFRDGKSVETNLNYARTNSDRLMLLVNELLDFRKIQSGAVRLQVREHDIVKTVKSVMAAFEHFASEKQIETSLSCPDSAVMVWYDIAQMQKVLYNLLGNAFKFTPDGGEIAVAITELSNEVSITVKDTGKGISAEHLQKLFTYYYQADSEKPGYGIGLALSKSIIEQHHGVLTAESRLATATSSGKTVLTIRLLRENHHFSPDQLVAKNNGYVNVMATESFIRPASNGAEHLKKTNTILIIEDNDQLRVFMRELFEGEYNTLEAENGLQGLELAREHIPDIILSDVMMPEMSGLEVCTRLKKGVATSHIPVVLLTARTQNEQIIEGLETGADDYVVKPFDPRILVLKINNLIRLRDEMKARYREVVFAEQQPGSSIAQDVNEAFIARLKIMVCENMSNPDFGVNELATQAGMSVSVLYRKMRSITEMTVNEFVKAIRLSEAKKLLESGAYHVNEVATMVGFDDAKYFSKEFKKAFGLNPTEAKRPIAD